MSEKQQTYSRAGLSLPPKPVEKLAFNIPEVCAATGVGRTTIYEAIKAGALKSIMVGGRRLVRREALANWLDGQWGPSAGNGRP